MFKEIFRLYNHNQTKKSTPTFKKPIQSSSATHVSPASNLTGTSISSKLDNRDITTDQNNNNTSNTDEIHSCVTTRKNNYSVQATSLNTTLPIVPIELHKKTSYPGW